MEEIESIKPELVDFEAGKAALFDAVQNGDTESATKLLENGVKDLQLLIMHSFRMAFKNNDLEMIKALIPFGNEREVQAKIGILEDAVKTNNAEIVGMVYSGLEIPIEMLKVNLLDRIHELLPEADAGLPAEKTNAATLVQVVKTASTDETIMDVLARLDKIDAFVIDVVLGTRNHELVYKLVEIIFLNGFTKEHAALFPWLKENWPDPELVEQLQDILSAPETSEE